MHFFNKLSTAALMRLTILASLDLLLYRLLGGWDFFLQPVVFLNLVTLNLGLYAVMVYSGTLNKALIGMMLGGLAATLAVFAYPGMDPQGAPRFYRIGRFLVESVVDATTKTPPVPLSSGPPPQVAMSALQPVYSRPPLELWAKDLVMIGWVVVDLMGLIAIGAGGALARVWQARSRRRDAHAAPLPLDARAASPM